MAPIAGSPPSGAGCGGFAGAGAPGTGGGDAAGSTEGCTPGDGTGAATTGDGTGETPGCGMGAGGGAVPDFCCCSQVWKSAADSVVTRNSIWLCPEPHSIAQMPRYSPA